MRDTQWSNLYLIISKLKGLHFQLKRRPQGQKVTKQLNTTKLKKRGPPLGTQFTLLPSKSKVIKPFTYFLKLIVDSQEYVGCHLHMLDLYHLRKDKK